MALRCAFEGSQTSLTTQNPKKYKIVQINELNGDARTSAHLLKFDSIHGRWHFDISSNDSAIQVEKNQIGYSSKATPSELDWGKSKIDLVIDATGQFKTISELQTYFDLGAKKVLVACPVKDHQAFNIVMGVNDHLYDPKKHDLVTAASCTTNAIVPGLKVIDENYTIQSGHIETVHAYTNDQNLIDNYHPSDRRGRSSALNLVITDTGAAKAVSQILPEMKGKLTANAIRVPTPNVSLAIMNLNVKKSVSVEELNKCFREVAFHSKLKTTIDYSNAIDAVSSDFYSNEFAVVFDSQATISNFNSVTIYCWYDNEYGYSKQVVRLLKKVLGINLIRYPKQ